MKSWKKRLNEEFDKAAPALNDEVLNAPIVTARTVTTRATQSARRKGGWFACGTAVALAAIFVTLGVLGVFNVAPKADKFVFALDINPSVSFVTDVDGKVSEVKALNSDADIVLSNSEFVQEEINDKPLSEAIVAYTDYAAQLGFLNVAEESAVRLSTSDETDDKLLKNVSSSLASYFKNKGIYAAVVEEKVTANDFAERLGVEGTSISELSSTLENVSTFFAERNVNENTNADELTRLHDDFVIGDQLLEYVKSELVNKLSDIKTFLAQIYLLGQIHLYNVRIMTDFNNPEWSWFVGADYWTIKEGIKNGDYTISNSDFAELISTMDELIAEYELKFDKLESYDFFESLYESMEKLIDSLSNIDSTKLEELSLSAIEESFEQYVEILSCVGVDVSDLKSLIAVPTTVEEYVNQLHVSWEQVTADRLAANEDAYNSTRKPLSDSAYDAFIAEIESKYGSLENFWQIWQNN